MIWLVVLFVLLIVGGVAIVLAGSLLVSRYNSFVQVQENVDKAWGNIEVVLKQRSDELPKLIDVAEHYLKQERDLLREVTRARTAVQAAEGPRAEAEADQELRGALGDLFAVAEDYPELRSSEQFQQLQKRISSLEERIADRREFYNESVTIFNTRTRQFPDFLFARAMGVDERELFQVDEADTQDVDVGARLNVGTEQPSASQDDQP